MNKPVLCYVDNNIAYFTTQNLSDQWGDNWGDAPYEHNAGKPYESDHEGDWEIIKVPFECDLYTPCDYFNCSNTPFSVRDINKGIVPWLISPKWSDRDIKIFAGTTLDEFVRTIKSIGGRVWMEV